MTRYIVVSRPNPHLPHDSEELQSPPPPDALTDEIAQKNAELIVSRLMGRAPAAAAPEAAAQAMSPRMPAVPRPARTPPPRAQNAATATPPARTAIRTPAKRAPEPEPAACRKDPVEARLRAALLEGSALGEDEETHRGLLARLRPVHGVALGVLLAALLWPVLIGVAALLLIGSAVVVTLLLRRAVAGGRWRRFARTHPRMAERLRRVADRAAVRVDRVLDLLPAGLADRLAWPDLSEPLSPGMG